MYNLEPKKAPVQPVAPQQREPPPPPPKEPTPPPPKEPTPPPPKEPTPPPQKEPTPEPPKAEGFVLLHSLSNNYNTLYFTLCNLYFVTAKCFTKI